MRLQNNDFARIKRACGYNAPGMMQLSEIGGHLTARTGIDDLMEDLFKALHSGDPGLCYAMIINRYGTGGYTFGLVRDFGLKKGADGSTVSHDCHNLCIVFKDAESGFAVFNALVECGGGMACADAGKVTGLLRLQVGGLMSTLRPEQMAEQSDAMKKALNALGLPQKNPLLRIATMALPVIPEAKFSDMGLVDVMAKKLIPIFPQ